jgi:hypothetical protein
MEGEKQIDQSYDHIDKNTKKNTKAGQRPKVHI